jgi:hypothetical protein
MFNVESTKECMSFFLLLDPIFHLWETNLVEWENCNILDNIGDMSTCPPMLIKKLTFGCLLNLKEKKLEKMVRGLLAKIILFVIDRQRVEDNIT